MTAPSTRTRTTRTSAPHPPLSRPSLGHPLPHAARTAAPPLPRQRRARPEEALPLGSLTQREHRSPDCCAACGSTKLTRLALRLTDGGAVDFISCQHCEHRRWEEGGAEVPVAEVLLRTARR